jgi:plasmid stability protein
MAALSIRNLPDDVRNRLRVRAAKAGRSMEAEAREILVAAVATADPSVDFQGVQEAVSKLYKGRKPRGVVKALITERRKEAAKE